MLLREPRIMTTPQSWTAVLDALYADSWNPALRRFRSPFAFRGLGRVDHVMSSSLFRLAGGADTQRLEMALLRNFRKYAHVEQSGADSIWDWLAPGQHRGLGRARRHDPHDPIRSDDEEPPGQP